MPGNGLFGILDISASGLSAQRKNLEVRASNIANAQSIDPKTGQPYRAREVNCSEIRPVGGFRGLLQNARLRLSLKNERHLEDLSHRDKDLSMGVEATQFQDNNSPTRLVYAPEHPNADENGYIETADINMVDEMVKMMTATRAYEANATVITAAKTMFKKALEI